VLIVWCVLAAFTALLYLLMLRNSQMTLREAFTYPINFRSATTVGGLYYVSGCALWCLWSLLWLPLVAMIGRPLSSIRVAILVALFGFAALFTFPYGSRGALLIPVIGVAWVVENTVLHKPLNILKLAPIVGALVIATGLLGVTRVVASTGPVTSGRVFEALQSGGLTSLLDHSMARFDTFDFLAMVVNKYIASGQHFLAGRSFFDLLIQPVPRSLYPDKPSQTSAFLTGIFYPELGRIWTPEYGMIAELYINFWVFGVIIGAVLFGILIRALDDYLQRHRHSPAILFWYAPLVTIPMSWTMSGFNSFASVVFVLDTFLAVVLLLLLRRRRTPTTIPA
jgi:hypothetical protein